MFHGPHLPDEPPYVCLLGRTCPVTRLRARKTVCGRVSGRARYQLSLPTTWAGSSLVIRWRNKSLWLCCAGFLWEPARPFPQFLWGYLVVCCASGLLLFTASRKSGIEGTRGKLSNCLWRFGQFNLCEFVSLFTGASKIGEALLAAVLSTH